MFLTSMYWDCCIECLTVWKRLQTKSSPHQKETLKVLREEIFFFIESSKKIRIKKLLLQYTLVYLRHRKSEYHKSYIVTINPNEKNFILIGVIR